MAHDGVCRVINWDDYRFLLAVEATGNFSAAAKRLGVSQPTVSRRMAALECRLGVSLFDRLPEGHRLSSDGERLCSRARLLEIHASEIERAVRDRDGRAAGRVGVTASEGIASAILTPLFCRLFKTEPDIVIDLTIANRAADILRHEADIALRIGDPVDDKLVGRRIASADFGIYAHKSYLERCGMPESVDDLSRHHLIESTGEIAKLPQAIWLRHQMQPGRITYASNSIANQLIAARAGLGILALPSYIAATVSNIERILARDYAHKVDVWLLTADERRKRTEIRCVLDFLASEVPRWLNRRPCQTSLTAN